MELAELVCDLDRRPEMFLPDRRYASLVAYIDGFALAQGLSLHDFQRWLLQRLDLEEPSSLHWGSLVALQVSPPGEGGALAALAESDQLAASRMLLSMLAEYLASATA